MRLRRMTQQEFEAFRDFSIADYGREIAQAEGVSSAEAFAQARGEFEAQLPQGVDTADNFLMVLERENEDVGSIWYQFSQSRAGVPMVFLCDFYVMESHRRKGIATEALRMMETAARENGCAEAGLYVWKNNTAGIALYRACGYCESQADDNGMFMKKQL